MNTLSNIGAGMSGALVANNINTNNEEIYKAITELEKSMRTLTGGTGTTTGGTSITGTSVNIVAKPESIVITSSNQDQKIQIPILVYCGSVELDYGGFDDGKKNYSIHLGANNGIVYGEGGQILAKITPSTANNKLVLNALITGSVNGNFTFEFSVCFQGVYYKKAISFTILESLGDDYLKIEFNPSNIIISEISEDEYAYGNAKSTYKVTYQGNDVTNEATVTIQNLYNCKASVDLSKKQIYFDTENGITYTGYDEGVELFSWTDIEGHQYNKNKVVSGYITVIATYNSGESSHRATGNLSFAVNRLGTFKETIVNDVHTQVSRKVINTLDENGQLITEEYTSSILQAASGIALDVSAKTARDEYNSYIHISSGGVEVLAEEVNECQSQISVHSDGIASLVRKTDGQQTQINQNASGITALAADVAGNTTKIKQNASGISLVQEDINDIEKGLSATGIDITSHKIAVTADQFLIKDNAGNTQVLIENGGINTNIINASNIKTKELHVTGSTGSVDIYGDTGILIASAASITGKIDASSGNIAGFKISGNGITNEGFSTDAYVIIRNDSEGSFTGIGANVMPASSGWRCNARFEQDSDDIYFPNAALYLKATGSSYGNFAFCGTGNGILKGMVAGYTNHRMSLTNANTISEISMSSASTIIVNCSASNAGVTFPTLYSIRTALGIGSSTEFSVPITIIAHPKLTEFFKIYGRNSEVQDSSGKKWMDSASYAYLCNNDETITSLTMGNYDVARFMLSYIDGTYYAFRMSHMD